MRPVTVVEIVIADGPTRSPMRGRRKRPSWRRMLPAWHELAATACAAMVLIGALAHTGSADAMRAIDPAPDSPASPLVATLRALPPDPLDLSIAPSPASALHEIAVSVLMGTGDDAQVEAHASVWIRESAFLGDPRAQHNLGVLYETGMGVSRDRERAALWYHSAAEQGLARAQRALARLYAHGQGLPASTSEARRWLARAAGTGSADAMRDLAVLSADPNEARQLIALARARGIDPAGGSDGSGAEARNLRIGGTPELILDLAADQVAGVEAIQRRLTGLGYYGGPIDGDLESLVSASFVSMSNRRAARAWRGIEAGPGVDGKDRDGRSVAFMVDTSGPPARTGH
jgi:hypothetical protein